ncbi:uncharacterized protein LOC105430115 isoform X2 [Pogonomyrmex barbatus]|uniref:Uncharacterized protein LOC105430115 isoform X2 n=1 Tax=Pogonomyrmex barbatus TaxID=144034 RepID=A0A6I9WK04_9HYME|nr:uncharacterized protein LOC105430115 isoform X2 [Pogonomyrmex barbatus]
MNNRLPRNREPACRKARETPVAEARVVLAVFLVDPRHCHHLFCFRRAHFFSTFLSVLPISASCSWLYMCSTLEKGELESSCESTKKEDTCIY